MIFRSVGYKHSSPCRLLSVGMTGDSFIPSRILQGPKDVGGRRVIVGLHLERRLKVQWKSRRVKSYEDTRTKV